VLRQSPALCFFFRRPALALKENPPARSGSGAPFFRLADEVHDHLGELFALILQIVSK
jgi:hypothetical protein